jgi:hypothetical protein
MPFHFLYTLKVLELIVVHFHIKNGGRLEQVAFGICLFSGPYSIDNIGLQPESLGIA